MVAPSSAHGLSYGPIKPLAVRLNESTRTQLDVISRLNKRNAIAAIFDATPATKTTRAKTPAS